MVTRWHLLHLPVSIAGRRGSWGWVDDIYCRWPDAVVEGFSVHTAISRRFVPAEAMRVTPMALLIDTPKYAQKMPRSWWNHRRRQVVSINQPVRDQDDQLVGRVKDFVIDENSLAIHHIVVSRGLLEDLMTGSLLIPAHQFSIDSNGRIKIHPTGAR
ncbi:MAG: hypothetical protein C7B44_10980 [Sulfobacillus thermosulfidooxidans]|uniref:PRC-barrel domain-containing protein n=1 Tax=Sulfobacillus thermotolerans TaxID=338644 RepID=A0ABM6RQ28_9FIRM|nr:hypothetical protein BXT84_05600 [Sulfobacillus thermotolerans]MCY0908156.1 PRC-barrel domain-containing protein [Sulfobacillus thermotolerans]PSR36068.1 MAG: hypothetical protein C7B44_10980 [Sulfobacillus thermosulfidooxidans]